MGGRSRKRVKGEAEEVKRRSSFEKMGNRGSAKGNGGLEGEGEASPVLKKKRSPRRNKLTGVCLHSRGERGMF